MAIAIVEFADHLNTRGIGGCNVSAQHVKMTTAAFIRDQVHTRLDNGIALALCTQAGIDRSENFMIRQCQRGNIPP